MSYNLTQSLYNINENNWEDEITANLEANQFIAVTAMQLNEEGTQREVTVQIMSLDGLPAGPHSTNTGLFVRWEFEKSVTANLLDVNGEQVDSNTTEYPD